MCLLTKKGTEITLTKKGWRETKCVQINFATKGAA